MSKFRQAVENQKRTVLKSNSTPVEKARKIAALNVILKRLTRDEQNRIQPRRADV